MRKIQVHRWDNLRLLCELNIEEHHHSRLQKPPPLTPHKQFVYGGIDLHGNPLPPREVDVYVKEDHVLEMETPYGLLRVFKVKSRGLDYFVTNTPDIAIKNAV